jgi:ABC-type transport system substrate-binding protein
VEKVKDKFKPDIDQAKKLLADAGYGPSNPLSFTMKMGNVPQDQGGEIAQAQLKKAGIDVKVDVLQGFAAGTIASRNYGAAWSGVSPASIFANRWAADFVRCGNSRNYTNLCDPQIDALSKAQSQELDVAKRRQIMDQLQERLFEIMPWVPTNSIVGYRIFSCRVQNMRSTEYTEQLTGLAEAWLDPTGC